MFDHSNNRIGYFIFAACCFFSLNQNSAYGENGYGSGYYFNLGLSGLYNNTQSKDVSYVSSRALYEWGAELNLGLRKKFLSFGVGGEIEELLQGTKPSSVNDVNMQGMRLMGGPFVGLAFNYLEIFVRWNILDKYSLSKTNSNGKNVSYSDSTGDLSLQIRYFTTPQFYYGLAFKTATYHSFSQDNNSGTLGESRRLKLVGAGLSMGLRY